MVSIDAQSKQIYSTSFFFPVKSVKFKIFILDPPRADKKFKVSGRSRLGITIPRRPSPRNPTEPTIFITDCTLWNRRELIKMTDLSAPDHQVRLQYERLAPTDKSSHQYHYAAQVRAHSSPSVATDSGNVLTVLLLQPPLSRKAFGCALPTAQECATWLKGITS